MNAFLETCLNGPNLLPTALLLLVCVYWALVILGAMDVELFDFDLDTDADVDLDAGTPFGGIGFVVLRFLNIGQVPLMIWVSFFTLTFWFATVMLAMTWDKPGNLDNVWSAVLTLLRNGAIAVVAAKLLTQPMRKWFEVKEMKPGDLIGQECEISSAAAEDSPGQARFRTDAAPLLLSVRSKEGTLDKGEVAVIVEYNPQTKIYLVERATREV